MKGAQLAKWALLVVLVLVLVGLLIALAAQIDLWESWFAFDWKIIHAGLNDAENHWSRGLYNPPWVVLPLLPMGALPVGPGWLAVLLGSAAVLVVGVRPRRPSWRFALAAIMVAVSFPAVRSLVDGNVDALAIAGVLLIMASLRRYSGWMLVLGVLLATAKPQATWLIPIYAALIFARARAWRPLIAAGLIAGAVIAVSMIWGGADWLGSMGQVGTGIALRGLIMGVTNNPITLVAALAIVALTTLWVALKRGRPETTLVFGFLMAGSLLTAPYGSGLSLVGIILLGVVPLAFAWPLAGVPVYLLFIMPYLGVADMVGLDNSVYRFPSLSLLISWVALLAYLTVRSSRRQEDSQAVNDGVAAAPSAI